MGRLADERYVIRALRRLAKRWPTSLWLYVAAGQVYVMPADGGDW